MQAVIKAITRSDYLYMSIHPPTDSFEEVIDMLSPDDPCGELQQMKIDFDIQGVKTLRGQIEALPIGLQHACYGAGFKRAGSKAARIARQRAPVGKGVPLTRKGRIRKRLRDSIKVKLVGMEMGRAQGTEVGVDRDSRATPCPPDRGWHGEDACTTFPVPGFGERATGCLS